MSRSFYFVINSTLNCCYVRSQFLELDVKSVCLCYDLSLSSFHEIRWINCDIAFSFKWQSCFYSLD